MFYGFFGSVALMSIIGRLNSKFINIPVWLGIFLYCYAPIQIMYVFFDYYSLSPELEIAHETYQYFKIPISIFPSFVMFFTLALKSMFFLVVTWLLKTGRLLFFIIEESSLNFIRDENFKQFLDSIDFEDGNLE